MDVDLRVMLNRWILLGGREERTFDELVPIPPDAIRRVAFGDLRGVLRVPHALRELQLLDRRF